MRRLFKKIEERVRGPYLVLLGLVAVLGTWNALAGYLDLPGPKVVSKSVREVFINRPTLVAYDISIGSSVGQGSVTSRLPLPPVCFDRAEIELLESEPQTVEPHVPERKSISSSSLPVT
jgi:hypothetical protein